MANETNNTPNFGQRHAILNLDWMTILLSAVESTPEGQDLIKNLTRWNEAIHQKSPRTLTVFTTLAFSPGKPEIEREKPFAKLIAPFGDFKAGSPETQIDSRFALDGQDVLLNKTRWCATTGNSLEQILKAQNIDTVVISGLFLSGVVMSTIYRLFDLDYNIYIIEDNVLELPTNESANSKRFFLQGLLPKMNLHVISLQDALKALKNS